MTSKRSPSFSRTMRRAVLLGLALLLTGVPALAAADGVPHLDPTNNNNGTPYGFVMPGASQSMDPALRGASFSWKGTLLVFQDAGAGNFDADMALDLNGDGTMDRSLACTGYVGNGRFSLRCSQNDGAGELRFVATGRAVVLDTKKLSLRRAGGRGFTDTDTFGFSFQATEQ